MVWILSEGSHPESKGKGFIIRRISVVVRGPARVGPWTSPFLGVLIVSVYLVRTFGIGFHLFADDSQLYIVFKPLSSELNLSVENTQNCTCAIDQWMIANRLKFNGPKTDMTVIGTRQMLAKLPSNRSVNICGSKIIPKSAVRNLGVIFDSHLSMKQHISNVCKTFPHV